MAKSVGDAAGAGAHLAPQAMGAWETGKAAALGADPAGGDVAMRNTKSVEARSAQRRRPRRKCIAILQKMLW
jgi:hypothetical protein